MLKMKYMRDEIWDVAVVGGGPAGMMAAGRAAELGAMVVLIEKNDSLGKKLLITGGGRCNVTNAEFDNRKLLEKFRGNGKFLFSAFSQWDVGKTLDFFHMKKMETKVEKEQRVFPVSDKAKSVWETLVRYIQEYKVTVLSKSPVAGVVVEGKKVIGVKLNNRSTKLGVDKIIYARSVIIATGGTSRPETGSTGDGYAWLRSVGHSVTEPTTSLVPLAVKDAWVKKLAGVTLTDIKLTVFQNGKKQDTYKGLPAQAGKILFTHFGISGPSILNMSKDIGELLKYGEVIVSLDLLPALDYGKLNAKLQEVFKEHDKKKLKNSLSSLIPSALVPIAFEFSKINPETECNSVTREERLTLVKVVKDIPMRIDKLLGADKAIISSGGVSLDEIDFKTMRSRLYPNLYLIGDILDIDRPSGGYSLQLCWTTGFVAGTSATEKN